MNGGIYRQNLILRRQEMTRDERDNLAFHLRSRLLSGWVIGEPDVSGEVGTQSGTTQDRPTFSRSDLGAGSFDLIFHQDGDNVKTLAGRVAQPGTSPVLTG